MLFEYTKPISQDRYLWLFKWYLVICVAFSLSLYVIKYVVLFLLEIQKTTSEAFHSKLLDEKGKVSLVIDYKKWKNAPMGFMNSLTKYVNLDTIEFHTIITLCLTFMTEEGISRFPTLAATMIVSILQHYRRSSKRSGDRKKAAGKKSNIRKRNYIEKMLNFYVKMYWVIIVVFHLLILLNNVLGLNMATVKDLKYTHVELIMLVFSSIMLDLSSVEDYFETRENLKKETDLKRKFAAICTAYEFNETKIYHRVTQIIAKTVLDQMVEGLLNYREKNDVMIDLNYSEQCIHRILRGKQTKLREKILGFGTNLKLSFVNWLYRTLIAKSNTYNFKDFLYLYTHLLTRNDHLAHRSKVNLEDYFDHRFESFENQLKKILINYDLLREGDAGILKTYERRLAKLQETPKNPAAFKIEIDVLNENRITLDYENMRKIIQIEELDKSMFKFAGDEEENETKDPELLKASAGIVLDSINKIKDVEHKKNHLRDQRNAFKKQGFVECTYGNMKVILFNISNDQMFKTRGFNVFSVKILSVHLLRCFKSNIETIIALSVLAIHVRYGGLINLLFVGVTVFCVLVEEKLGQSFWWKFLYIFYLGMSIFQRLPFSGQQRDVVNFFVGSNSNYITIIPILLIMFLIETLKKGGFSK